MRKTLAFIVGALAVLGLGPAALPPSLQAIGLWLSPVLGTELYTVFTVFHLLTGDPLRYAAVGLLWLGASFAGGLIVRRRLGAALTMLSVWLLMVPVMALSLVGLALNVMGLMESHQGSLLSLLPPIPPGMTVTGLLETPVVGDTISRVMAGDLSIQGMEEAMSLLEEAAYGAAASTLVNPALVVLGALLGAEAGMLLERRGLLRLPGGPSAAGALKASAVALVIAGASIPWSGAQLIDTSDGVYVEQILGLSDAQGRALVVEAFAATGDRRPGHANLVAHLIVSQRASLDSIVEAMNLSVGYDVASLVNLAPSTLLVTVYVDTPADEAAQDARLAASAAAERYGAAFRFMGVFEAPEMEFEGISLPRLMVAVSFSDIGMEEAAPLFLDGFSGRGGLAQAVSGALSSGALIPGASESSPGTTLLVSGFVNPGPILDRVQLPSIPEELEEPLAVIESGSLEVALGAHIWEDGVASNTGGFTLDLSSLLGGQTVTLSPTADLSLVTLMTPNGTRVGELTPNIVVTTDQPEDSYVLSLYTHLLGGLGVIEVSTDETPGPGALIAYSSMPLAPSLEVERTLDRDALSPGDTVRVTVTATNLGSSSVENVVLRDTGLAESYGAVTVSGETVKVVSSLAPGQSTELSYSATLRNPGTYTLRPAKVTYSSGGAAFTGVSERRVLGSGPPGVLGVLGTLRLDAIAVADLITGGRGRTVIDASIAAVGLLVLLNVALSLRRAGLGARAPALAGVDAQKPPLGGTP